jgi:hypothetical protein
MTTSVVSYQNDTIERPAQVGVRAHVVTADEDTANSAAISLAALGTVVKVVHVQIRNGSNVFRSPQGAVTVSGNTVTVADSGLAANEEIFITAVGYAA